MVISPTTIVFTPVWDWLMTNPSFLSYRLSMFFIPFTTTFFKYLLWIFYLLSWVINFWVTWLWLRSILATKLLKEHFLIASIASRLFMSNWVMFICLILFFMYRFLISDLLYTFKTFRLLYIDADDSVKDSFTFFDTRSLLLLKLPKLISVLQFDLQLTLESLSESNMPMNSLSMLFIKFSSLIDCFLLICRKYGASWFTYINLFLNSILIISRSFSIIFILDARDASVRILQSSV
jgi:hypothetical protein